MTGGWTPKVLNSQDFKHPEKQNTLLSPESVQLRTHLMMVAIVLTKISETSFSPRVEGQLES